MTIRHPALEKLDDIYRMTTGKEIPPMAMGKTSIISSVDPGSPGDFRKPEPEAEPEAEVVSENDIRHWMNVCETQGTTNQSGRPTAPTRPSTSRPAPPARPAPPRPGTITFRPPASNQNRTPTAPTPVATRRRTRFTVEGQVPAHYRADMEFAMSKVQSKLESEGLGQLLAAARVKFCWLDSISDTMHVAGQFAFDDNISIHVELQRSGYVLALFHELGHRFHIRKRENPNQEGEIDRQIKAWFEIAKRDASFMPSDYARTNYMEFWAECFCYYMAGTLTNARLRTWVKSMIVAFRIVTRR